MVIHSHVIRFEAFDIFFMVMYSIFIAIDVIWCDT